MAVILSKNFDINRITFSKPAVLKSGAKQAYVNYDGGKLILQTPAKVTLPFGVSEFKTDDKNPPVYSLDLSFRDKEHNAAMMQLFTAMQALDEMMIDTAVEKSVEWFGKAKKREVIEEELYTPTVRRSKDDKYPPTMKLKLPQKDGVFDAKFYDEKRTQFVDFDVKKILPRNSVVTCIIQCAGVWFAGGKFGLSWRAVQVMIHSKPEELGDFGFAADDGLELTETASAVTAVTAVSAMMPSETNEVDDEEAFAETPVVPVASKVEPEEDLDEEMEPEAVPKKPLVKKKVVAKK